jgi:hypothetical protein
MLKTKMKIFLNLLLLCILIIEINSKILRILKIIFYLNVIIVATFTSQEEKVFELCSIIEKTKVSQTKDENPVKTNLVQPTGSIIR